MVVTLVCQENRIGIAGNEKEEKQVLSGKLQEGKQNDGKVGGGLSLVVEGWKTDFHGAEGVHGHAVEN